MKHSAETSPRASGNALHAGLVVASFGRHCLVEDRSGERRICHPRGKKNQVVVGDQVLWQTAGDEGSIEQVQTRRNLLYRQDDVRTKSFAANLDQILVLLAADPDFSESQLTRALVAAEAAGIPVRIALNKRDVQPAFDRAWARLAPYRRMGYSVLPLQLQADAAAPETDGVAELLQQLSGRHSLVLGPSGVGKSTLINRLVPHAQVLTGEVSRALHAGKHTTTSTTWYWTDAQHQTALIDSPGFQSFGLHHLETTQLAQCMPDLRRHLGHCRFYNCTHLHEPGCAVLARVATLAEESAQADAADSPTISPARHQIYRELFEELSNKRRY